jgi:hypothetical protein
MNALPMESEKKKAGITMGELLGAIILVLGVVLTFWKTTDVRLSALELRMNQREKAEEMLVQKLDKLQEGVNDVKVMLQNKADR